MKRPFAPRKMRKCNHSRRPSRNRRLWATHNLTPEQPQPCALEAVPRRHPPLYDYLVAFADDFVRDFGPDRA